MSGSSKLERATRVPLLVQPTRVYRVYTGGRLIDEFRGAESPEDGSFPEDWVASDTQALNPGREHLQEGLSVVTLPDGGEIQLKELIEQLPQQMLGEKHVERWGRKTALLVKLLDAAVRLPVHCHPGRAFAREHMNSPHGKTECWIIKETRVIDGVEPYLAMGFKSGVTREDLADWVRRQDGEAMLGALNKFPVKPGDVYMVTAGLPHAIGEGLLMVEVQEPSDWYVLAEYRNFNVPEEEAHQQKDWELALESFDYTTFSMNDVETVLKQPKTIVRQAGESAEYRLISAKYEEFFGASELVVNGAFPMRGGAFYVGITDSGCGRVVTGEGELPIKRGSTFAVPAGAGEHEYRSDAGTALQVTICFPPKS
jgi:mannose-6-phosphate isomerase